MSHNASDRKQEDFSRRSEEHGDDVQHEESGLASKVLGAAASVVEMAKDTAVGALNTAAHVVGLGGGEEEEGSKEQYEVNVVRRVDSGEKLEKAGKGKKDESLKTGMRGLSLEEKEKQKSGVSTDAEAQVKTGEDSEGLSHEEKVKAGTVGLPDLGLTGPVEPVKESHPQETTIKHETHVKDIKEDFPSLTESQSQSQSQSQRAGDNMQKMKDMASEKMEMGKEKLHEAKEAAKEKWQESGESRAKGTA